MRVTTAQSFDRPSLMMNSLNAQADRLQTQIGTGKKIAAPSDSATGWQQLAGIKRAAADDTAFADNVKLAQSLLASTDGVLGSVETQLQRAKAFAVQANTGTLSDADRNSILQDVQAILGDLLDVANTKDARGYPLFGGATGDAAYARQADGSIAYVGQGEAPEIPIGDGVSIAATENGPRVFGEMFAILSDLAAALQPGADSGGIEAAMDGLDATLDQVTTARASVGARAFRMDLEGERLADVAIDREAARAGIEETDPSTAIAELQKTLTVLQATQASFTKLTSMSLFDYLR